MTVQQFHCTNKNGLTLTVLNYGAIIQSLITPDGQDLVLGYATAEDYVKANPCYLGAIIGPLANRVAKARFTIDANVYQLDNNENQQHCLHAGAGGLHQVYWQVSSITQGFEFTYTAAVGEAGFPGPVRYQLCYQLTDDNQLILDYAAHTEQPTAIDLTNHTYWHLGGDVLTTTAQFNAAHYLAVDTAMIPTGKRLTVDNTPLDFQQPKTIGKTIRELAQTQGYDHYFIVAEDEQLKPQAEFFNAETGIHLAVSSTTPGFQFYSGNFLPEPYSGFCVETQNFPNAINQANFPSALVTPTQPYQQQTIYQLSFDQ